MNITELLAYLDIEAPEEFEYFEHLADLLELEEELSHDVCYTLFSGVSEQTVTELLANYFEEIMENLPGDTIDIYTLLTTIRQSLLGLARGLGDHDGTRAFTEAFVKFRNWYSLDSRVRCKRLSDGLCSDVTVCEALALCRLEKLGDAEYDYDFADCLDYEVEEYSISLSDMLEDDCDCGSGCDRREDDDDDYEDDFDDYGEGLIDRSNPVIDGEYDDQL